MQQYMIKSLKRLRLILIVNKTQKESNLLLQKSKANQYCIGNPITSSKGM